MSLLSVITEPLSQTIHPAETTMAPKSSVRTLRIRGISCEISADELVALIEPVRSTESRHSYRTIFALSTASTIDQPSYSFAKQSGFITSTASVASADTKAKIIKRIANGHADWEVDDHFAGLTVLSAPDNVDLE